MYDVGLSLQRIEQPEKRDALFKQGQTGCLATKGRTARCCYKFRHNGIVHAVTVVKHGFLIQAYISDRSNAEIAPHSTLIFTAVTQNHSDSRRSRHTTKITGKNHGDREYVIILQR